MYINLSLHVHLMNAVSYVHILSEILILNKYIVSSTTWYQALFQYCSSYTIHIIYITLRETFITEYKNTF